MLPSNTFYFATTCPFAQRVSIVLLELFDEDQLSDYEFIEIDLLNKPIWFQRLNPTGKVPVLQFGERVMVESLSICEYLLEVNWNHDLIPNDVFEKYKMRAFIERFMQTVCIQFYKILKANSQEQIETSRKLLLESLSSV